MSHESQLIALPEEYRSISGAYKILRLKDTRELEQIFDGTAYYQYHLLHPWAPHYFNNDLDKATQEYEQTLDGPTRHLSLRGFSSHAEGDEDVTPSFGGVIRSIEEERQSIACKYPGFARTMSTHEGREFAIRGWDTASYVTAQSSTTRSTFYTAVSGDCERAVLKLKVLQETDDYARLLQSKKLWPVEKSGEQDWSGRGQHVEFEDTEREREHINQLLRYQKTLGNTETATVQSVRCRRILLARKTVFCSKSRITKSEAINEVAHLTQLRHPHILRLIGTYVIGNELSILLYPVTEDNLESFLDRMSKCRKETSRVALDELCDLILSCEQFLSCLANAVEHIHSAFMKHMDIKPQNILVEARPSQLHRIYIADFGISRSYKDKETSNTDGPTSYTFKYAAPEVVSQDQRGLAADIFSLGCVYFEIYEELCLSTIPSQGYECLYQMDERMEPVLHQWKKLELQPDDERVSYQSNIEALQDYLSRRFESSPSGIHHLPTLAKVIHQMISRNPADRPVAAMITSRLEENCLQWPKCWHKGPVKLEAHPRFSNIE